MSTSFLTALSSASAQTIGLGVALVLIVALRLLLPESDRRLMRQPTIFLVAHLVLRAFELLLGSAALSAFGRLVSLTSLGLLLACIGRSSVILVLDVLMHRRLLSPVPKIIHDIVQGVVYFVVLLAILRAIGFEPGQILTTSAVLTAVIGLSLQDTLGNLVAGLAVQIQKPFDVGDWIQFDQDNKNIGRVVEINWRATRLMTLDEIEVVVPNGLLAKSPLRNFTKPTKIVRRSVMVQASYEHAPRRVHQIILEAIGDCDGVVRSPPPNVVTNSYNDQGVEYWVRYYTDRFGARDGIDGGVRDRIWYAFSRAGIRFPVPQRVIHMNAVDEHSRERDIELKVDAKESALGKIDFLRVVSTEQRRELARLSHKRLFAAGEVVVRQGDTSDELFLILRGEVVVLVESDMTATEVTRLGTGMFFGEMALVTGERRKATVRAARDCELLVIDHDAFERVLRENPAIVEGLSQVLAARQLELDDHMAAASQKDRGAALEERSSVLMDRIKKWFSLGK